MWMKSNQITLHQCNGFVILLRSSGTFQHLSVSIFKLYLLYVFNLKFIFISNMNPLERVCVCVPVYVSAYFSFHFVLIYSIYIHHFTRKCEWKTRRNRTVDRAKRETEQTQFLNMFSGIKCYKWSDVDTNLIWSGDASLLIGTVVSFSLRHFSRQAYKFYTMYTTVRYDVYQGVLLNSCNSFFIEMQKFCSWVNLRLPINTHS